MEAAAAVDLVKVYLQSSESEKRRLIDEVADNGRAHTRAVGDLAELYAKETDESLKGEILDELAWIGSPQAFDAILQAVKAEAPGNSRESAVEALESVIDDLPEIGGSAALDRIARGLADDLPVSVRIAAIDAMSDSENPDVIPYLEPLLTDANAEIREAARDAIDWLRDP